MGVVYKAEDTKLDRPVALKFLPPHLLSSEQDKARFVLEAKSASALNHPNVATVYEIDTVDNQMFIAMEFVDGVTLREKMPSVSMKQAIDIGIQLADGLAAAHEKGIVHRDIKPENIMVRKDGICQIMDFGLAKLRGKKSQVNRLTKEGSTIGTAGYMSPEQVQGFDVDHRSDIFSLGVVLYELITGELPFKGVHETALLYEIVNVDAVPMSAVKQGIDPGLDAIILECLVKEPGERYQSVAEVAKELRRYKRESTRQRVSRVTAVRPAMQTAAGGMPPQAFGSDAGAPPLSNRPYLWMAAALLFFLTTAAAGWLYYSAGSADPLPYAFDVLPPEGGAFESPLPAVSPDGKTLAYTATDSVGKTGIWVRPMTSLVPRRLNGTDGASFPFWSPDNRSIGFFIDGRLQKVDVVSGTVQTICDAASGRGGSWNRDGRIIFAADFNTPISIVSAAGGKPQEITTLDSAGMDVSHRFPYFLPDGKHFIYYRRNTIGEKSGVQFASVDGKESRFIVAATNAGLFYPPSSLLVLHDRILTAQKFDPSNGALSGDPVPVAENVSSLTNYVVGDFSVSETGTLAYMQGEPSTRQLIWFDRTARELRRTPMSGQIFDFRLSPDMGRLVCRRVDPQTGNNDIWMLDLTRGTTSRFTFDPSIDDDPVWSPDGLRVVFDSNPGGVPGLYVKSATGADNPVLLYGCGVQIATLDWSSDGKTILFFKTDQETKGDIWALPLESGRKPFPYLHTKATEANARFSPDSRWVAYDSDESGKPEVYLQPFPGPGGKWQVSTNGGAAPSFRRDGKEMYYLSPDKRIMAVSINVAGTSVQIGDPVPLMRTSVDTYVAPNRYDIAPDGRTFLVNTLTNGSNLKPFTVLVNRLEQALKH